MERASSDLEDDIVASIRRIVRAIDLHSRRLVEESGLTGPQLATLRAAHRLGSPSTTALARSIHLGQPTMSGILDRLERHGLVERRRSSEDRRAVLVTLTEKGEALDGAPSLLQDRFRAALADLAEWEQHMILAVLQRIATMMDAGGLDASPHLETGSLSAVPVASSSDLG